MSGMRRRIRRGARHRAVEGPSRAAAGATVRRGRTAQRGARHRVTDHPSSMLVRGAVMASLSVLAGVTLTTTVTTALWKSAEEVSAPLEARNGIFYSVERLDVTGSADVATSDDDLVGITVSQSDVAAMLAPANTTKTIKIPIKASGRLDPESKALETVAAVDKTAIPANTVLSASTFTLTEIQVTGTPDPQAMCTSPTAVTVPKPIVPVDQVDRTGVQYWCLTIVYTPDGGKPAAQNGRYESKAEIKVQERVNSTTLGTEATASDTWQAYLQGDQPLLWWKHQVP